MGAHAGDHGRPLALRGRTQARQLGQDLGARDCFPQAVLCSDALRTRQTWDLVGSGLKDQGADLAAVEVQVLADLYDAAPTRLLALLDRVDPAATTVFVVGHEPTISMTAGFLADGDSDDGALAQVKVGVPTATACVLTSTAQWGQWTAGSATLQSVSRVS
ncbi:phosphohistidine phosphatase [Rarobacter incanus]|uniref:Phosphohistidine phosphatase n=2 Tax=Rarobacter incanus TaxID=153494 RepID=A0A542SMD2_9MICO|nr:phosphohistidine phosphatase [Rarobacter incanus]